MITSDIYSVEKISLKVDNYYDIVEKLKVVVGSNSHICKNGYCIQILPSGTKIPAKLIK